MQFVLGRSEPRTQAAKRSLIESLAGKTGPARSRSQGDTYGHGQPQTLVPRCVLFIISRHRRRSAFDLQAVGRLLTRCQFLRDI